MAPRTITNRATGVLFEDDPVLALETSLNHDHEQISKPKRTREYKRELVWRNIIIFIFLHGAALYGAYLTLASAKLWTTIWGE